MRLGMKMALLALVVVVMAGCGGKKEQVAAAQGSATGREAANAGYTSPVLVTSYANAVPAEMQLQLGSLRLEGSELAITAEQAKAMLPLWQILQSNAVKGQAETNAVLKQIEEALTAAQLQAIVAMQITGEDMRTWMEEHGVEPPQGEALQGAAQGGERPQGALPNEEGGGPPNMTEAERASLRATVEAGGQPQGGARPGGPGAPGGMMGLAQPLIQLLTERAAQ